jgi:predicted  nucleic acid-binding Zn-ribbon protein
MDKQDKIIKTLADMQNVQDKIVESIVDLQSDMKVVKVDVATTKAEVREIKDNVEGFVKLHTKIDCEVAALHSRVERVEDRMTPVEKALRLKAA